MHPRVKHRGRARQDLTLWLLVLPGAAWLLIFYIVPSLGDIIAFENYLPFIGFIHSQWVGLQNFSDLVHDRDFWHAAKNTLTLWGLQVVLDFPVPIIFALILSSLMSLKLRAALQSIAVMPHFLSWVVVVGMYNSLFGRIGALNQLLRTLGLPQVEIVTNPALFQWTLTLQLIWKETGWGTVIYLAAMVMIDTRLYEAAAVDGAGHWRRLWHITLPGISGIVLLFLILQIAQFLSTGAEQVLIQQVLVGNQASEILSTYVYSHAIGVGEWSLSTAAGIINGAVGLVLILICLRLFRRVGFSAFEARA